MAGDQLSRQNGFRSQEPSRIVEFYNGRCILVTGVSGFIGKLLVEKLLRACTGLSRIYVLIRSKRKKSASDRFVELFNSPIFDKIRSTKFNDDNDAFQCFVSKKIHPIEGDLTKPLLGLAVDTLNRMATEVSVVFHSAALLSYDGNLSRSIKTNIGGAQNVLEVASRLPKLASFVHVSTCYSNCTRFEVDEHIYPFEQEPMKVINMANCLDDEMLNQLRVRLIGEHPNQYTFTKQVAEYLVGQYGVSKRLPVIICRPSIVVNTLEEPMVGYTDNRNGMNGAYWGMNRGLLRTMFGVSTSIADQVPADIVVNSIIALGWFGELYNRVGTNIELSRTLEATDSLVNKAAKFYRDRKVKLTNKLNNDDSLHSLKHRESIRVPVCHVSSGVENPVSVRDMLDYVAAGGKRYPSINLFREPRCRFTTNTLLLAFKRFWFHTLTGFLMNLFSLGIVLPPSSSSDGNSEIGQKNLSSVNWLREFQSIDRFTSLVKHFASNTWYFNPEMRQRLMKDFMNSEDNRIFNCDTSNIDWRQFGDKIALGTRKYILGEQDETIEEARIKYRETCWRNAIIQLVMLSMGLLTLFKLKSTW